MRASAGVSTSTTSRSLHVEKRGWRAGIFASVFFSAPSRHAWEAARIAARSPGTSPSAV